MGNNFAQTITMLRNQRGLSQKVAAQKLGISQGLLSHYEKGIRECGLDFVIKAAEFYSVSCGYLLGVEGNSGESVVADSKISKRASQLVDSIFTINEMSAKLGGENLCKKTNDIMSVVAYKVLRILDESNKTGAFDLDMSRSLINSSAFENNNIAKISNSIEPLESSYELRKDTEKLIKHVEQKLDVM